MGSIEIGFIARSCSLESVIIIQERGLVHSLETVGAIEIQLFLSFI